MLKVLPILAVFAVLVTLGIFSASLFNIQSIQAQTDNKCVNTDFIKSAANLKGQNLLTFSDSELTKKLKKQYPCVLGVTTEKVFPSTLNVTVTTKLPLARIEGTRLAISNQGMLVENNDSSLPAIFLPDQKQLAPNTAIEEPSLLFVSKVLAELKDSDFIVSSVRIIDPGNIIVYNRENALAIFSAQGDANRQIGALQEVIAKSKIDATKIEKIDLRFDKPILVFK